MPIKKLKPTSPGRRQMTLLDTGEAAKVKPLKKLTRRLKRKGGRNNLGRITAPHRGGGTKRRYREIDFRRNKDDNPARVESLEKDPFRSSLIARVVYADGERRYVVAPLGVKKGESIISGEKVDIQPGNTLPLGFMPSGTMVHNIELRPGRGAQLVRSAGGTAQLLAKEGDYAHVKMPSGEVRLISLRCRATVGQVGNIDHQNVSLGKAGRTRWLGRRPRVRAVAMNPVDHPMGGGEGKSSGGRHPTSRKGTPAKGYKTGRGRRNKWMVIKARKSGK